MNVFSVVGDTLTRAVCAFVVILILCAWPALAGDELQNNHQVSLVSIDASGHYVYTGIAPPVRSVSVQEARRLVKQETDKKKSRKPEKAAPLKPEPVQMADDPLPCNQGTYPCDIPIICMPAPPPYPYGAGTGCGGSCLSAARRIAHRVIHIFG